MLQRRHPVALARGWIGPGLLLALWLLASLFALPFISGLSGLQPDPYTPPGPGIPRWIAALLGIGWLGIAALALLWAGYILLDWRADWVALTTRRIILMEKTPFLREMRREAPILKVQNVVAEYPRPLNLALDFGDIVVDTAGVGVLTFKATARPRIMREAIFAQQESLRARQPQPEDRRKAAVRAILLGADPHDTPTPPNGYRAPPPAASTISRVSLLGSIFPFGPVRREERVTWHKHWIFLLRGLAWPVLTYTLAIAALIAAIAAGAQGMVGPLQSLAAWVVVLLGPACLLWAVWNWEDWRNDLYELDRERVYDIESLPFGLRERSKETLITRISDVMYVVPGPLAAMLNYGDVILKTPGEATEFAFTGIPCPRKVQQEIMERVDEYRLMQGASADQEIEAWLKAYHDVTSGQ